MKTIVSVFILVMSVGQPLLAQKESQKYSNDNIWSTLAKVTYESSEDEFGMINLPVFSDEVKTMENTEVSVPGYIIPAGGLDAVFEPDHFVLSSLPLAACFFCGVGGPETVVEVYLKDPIEYTDTPVKVRGKLTLNAYDIYQLMYILEEAELVEEVN